MQTASANAQFRAPAAKVYMLALKAPCDAPLGKSAVVGRSPTKPCTDRHSSTWILWSKSQALKYEGIPIKHIKLHSAIGCAIDYSFHYCCEWQWGIANPRPGLLSALQGVSSFHWQKDGWTTS